MPGAETLYYFSVGLKATCSMASTVAGGVWIGGADIPLSWRSARKKRNEWNFGDSNSVKMNRKVKSRN